MADSSQSVAVVDIDRASRFGKQLVSHLGRRTGGEWSTDTGTGWIDLQGDRGTVEAEGGTLTLRVEGPPDHLQRLEEVLGGHLVRFATDLQVHVSWSRSDGTAGSQQFTERAGPTA